MAASGPLGQGLQKCVFLGIHLQNRYRRLPAFIGGQSSSSAPATCASGRQYPNLNAAASGSPGDAAVAPLVHVPFKFLSHWINVVWIPPSPRPIRLHAILKSRWELTAPAGGFRPAAGPLACACIRQKIGFVLQNRWSGMKS